MDEMVAEADPSVDDPEDRESCRTTALTAAFDGVRCILVRISTVEKRVIKTVPAILERRESVEVSDSYKFRDEGQRGKRRVNL